MDESPLDKLRKTSSRAHAQERRNTRAYAMLDIRQRNGDRLALPYAYLVAIELQMQEQVAPVLVLSFTSHEVQVFGRNLQQLYEELTAHACAILVEDDSEFDDGRAAVHIERIVTARMM